MEVDQDLVSLVVKMDYQWISKTINIDKIEIAEMLNELFDSIQDVKYHV